MNKLTKQKCDLLDFIRESADEISEYCSEFQAEFIRTDRGNPPEYTTYDVSVLETHHYHLEVILEKLNELENKQKTPCRPKQTRF